jgi:AraC-like DNA-binding protein
MKIPEDTNIPRSEWNTLIDEWIFNKQHREMLKLNLLDGDTYEQIAEQLKMSPRHIARLIPKLKKQLYRHLS